jgi:hypothetical protein
MDSHDNGGARVIPFPLRQPQAGPDTPNFEPIVAALNQFADDDAALAWGVVASGIILKGMHGVSNDGKSATEEQHKTFMNALFMAFYSSARLLGYLSASDLEGPSGSGA